MHMVEFNCSSLDKKLAPGEKTITFDDAVPGLQDFYMNCIGHQRCLVKHQLILELGNGIIIQDVMTDTLMSQILTCKGGLYFSLL